MLATWSNPSTCGCVKRAYRHGSVSIASQRLADGRIDFAWPKLLVGVEINGLVWGRPGGHQTVKGIIAAAEKHEALMMEGWRVLQVPGPWVAEGNRSIWRPRTMDTLKLLLGRGEE